MEPPPVLKVVDLDQADWALGGASIDGAEPEVNDPKLLREQARKCRRLARDMTDDRTIATLTAMAEAYEQEARCADARDPSIAAPRPVQTAQ